MAQNFNYKTFTGRLQVDNSEDIATVLAPNGTNNVFLYGNRRKLISLDPGYLPLPTPVAGYPVYSYYQTYLLPSNLTTNPNGLADWFAKCGYQVSYGLSGALNINNVFSYTTSPDGNTAQLYFVNQQYNTQALANRNVSGTANILTTNGVTLLSASLESVQNGSYSQVANGTFTGSIATTTTPFTSGTITVDPTATPTQSTTFVQDIAKGSTLTFTVSGSTTPINAIINSFSVTASGVYTLLVSIPTATASITAGLITGTYLGITKICDTILTLTALGTLPFAVVGGNNIALNFVIASSDIDPANTEPFVYNLWVSAKCLESSTSLNPNATVTPPNVYFAILPDEASTNFFGPISTTPKLNPFNLTGLVNIQPSPTTSSVLVSIPTSYPFVSFIPNVTLGNSTLSQGTSTTPTATGLIQSWVVNGNNLDITLINVTGTFLANTSPVTNTYLTLDTTATILSLKNTYFAGKLQSQRGIPCIYEVVTDQDIVTYQAVFNDVLALNEPVLANVNQGNCSIVFGAINVKTPLNPQQALAKLVSGDPINNQFYEPVYQYFVQRAGIRPVTTASVLCAVTCILASNTYPFNPLNDILLDGITSSPLTQDWIDLTPGGVGDSLIGLGYNVLFTNSSGQTYLNLGRTGLTVVDNVPDNEFYPTYIVDVKDYNRKAIYIIVKESGIGQVRQTPITILAVRNAINNLLDQQARDGIIPLSIVASLKQQVIVQRSTKNPLGLYIYYPLVQNPAFLNAYVEINNYSINAEF